MVVGAARGSAVHRRYQGRTAMSDPKAFGLDQYAVWTHDLNGPINPLGSLATSEDESMKIVVTYADHVEALRQERERIRAACIEMKHRDGCACDVIDTLNRIDAAPRVSGRSND
jgi:hypothetical protein